MKYHLKFPDMDTIHDECEGVIRGTTPRPCHECAELTEYIEINYIVPFCSEECVLKFEVRNLE